MIRLIQRRLVIPRGDTGFFTVPLLENIMDANAVAVFSIFNENKRLYQQIQPIGGNVLTFSLEHDDTKDFPIGIYNWDIKIYTKPQYNSKNELINGDEVHSYYAAFELPKCEVVPYEINERG